MSYVNVPVLVQRKGYLRGFGDDAATEIGAGAGQANLTTANVAGAYVPGAPQPVNSDFSLNNLVNKTAETLSSIFGTKTNYPGYVPGLTPGMPGYIPPPPTDMTPIILLGGLGLAAFLLLKK